MVTIISGLVGGLIATIIMTLFMMVLGDDSPPPTALFWSKYIGDQPPDQYMPQGMLLHLIYGTGAGGVFSIIITALGLSVATLGSALLWGFTWGFVLFIIAAVFWMMLILNAEADMAQIRLFLLFHLIYGGVLGAWTTAGIVA